jgi:pimeloyl-ACP methyl ester carboxylesterase
MLFSETIRALSMLASEAYKGPLSSKAEIIRDFDGQIRGFSVVDNYAVTIALAGTKSIQDARIDGDIRRQHISGGAVHRGFWKEYESIQIKLARLILDNPNKLVRLCGHSLGGALAVYAAVDAKAMKCDVDLVTLGCPAPGDSQFKRFFEKLGIHHVRIVHAYDLVPHVPFIGYSQISKPIVLSDSGKRVGSIRGGFGKLFRLFRILVAWMIGREIRDHHVSFYLKAINTWCDFLPRFKEVIP